MKTRMFLAIATAGMLLAGCGYDFEGLRIELVPEVRISGTGGRITVLSAENAGVFKTDGGICIKTGKEFSIVPDWYRGQERIDDPPVELPAPTIKFTSPELLTKVDDKTFIADKPGRTEVEYTLTFSYRGQEYTFRARDTITISDDPMSKCLENRNNAPTQSSELSAALPLRGRAAFVFGLP